MVAPGPHYRYILDLDFRRFNRHLLLGPYYACKLHGESAALLLYGLVHQTNQFFIELTFPAGPVHEPRVIEAAVILDDPKTGRAKARGTNDKPGTFAAFIDVVQQLDPTHETCSACGAATSWPCCPRNPPAGEGERAERSFRSCSGKNKAAPAQRRRPTARRCGMETSRIVQEAPAQIPWYQNIALLEKPADPELGSIPDTDEIPLALFANSESFTPGHLHPTVRARLGCPTCRDG